MERQIYEPEVHEEVDDRRMGTADLVSSADRANTTAERATTTNDRPTSNGESGVTALFGGDEATSFRSRWEKIQINFVDEPRKSVEQADELVAAVIKRLAEVFADERNKLEHDWDKGDSVSTEDLRVTLRKYRSFFDRLLSV
jgi:hypothetical protein